MKTSEKMSGAERLIKKYMSDYTERRIREYMSAHKNNTTHELAYRLRRLNILFRELQGQKTDMSFEMPLMYEIIAIERLLGKRKKKRSD
jgi:hypothetical protein